MEVGEINNQTGVLQFQGFFDGTEYLYSQIPCPACYGCTSSQKCAGDYKADPSQGASGNDSVDGRKANQKTATLTDNGLGIMKCVLSNDSLNISFEGKKPYLKDALYKHTENDRYLKCGLPSYPGCHHQVAQLILWREIDRIKKQVNYQAALNGASGPATKALSALVVNDAHRKRVFSWTNSKIKDASGIRTTPLSIMQQELRKELLECIKSKLEQEIATSDQSCKDKYIYTSISYLSSVLYQYFIPFLSLENEERIVNGLTYYLAALIASKRKVKIDPSTLTNNQNSQEDESKEDSQSKMRGLHCANGQRDIAEIVRRGGVLSGQGLFRRRKHNRYALLRRH